MDGCHGVTSGLALLSLLSCLLSVSVLVVQVSSHGRLIEPPSRASMWRYGFKTPADYDDHQSYCGGFGTQWTKYKGKCGICGDPWDAPQPRAHEAGGTYGRGIIVRRYKMGSTITIRVEITANHFGHFEFRLCKNNAPKVVATQACLDKNELLKAKSSAGDRDHPTRYYIGSETKVYEMRYVLPKGLTCSQCVLQWKYLAANSWGMCNETHGAIGCGPQEQFRACADVAIEDKDGTSDETPYDELGDNEIDTEGGAGTKPADLSQPKDNVVWLSLVTVLAGMFMAIFVIVMVFVYYYGANQTIKPCWHSTLHGARVVKIRKNTPLPPTAPPRTKKTSNNLASLA